MEYIEVSGKTLNEAITNALLKLEIPIFDLFYAINFLYLKILALAILLQ